MGPVTPWGRSYGDPMASFLWGRGRSYGAGDPMGRCYGAVAIPMGPQPFLWGR